MFEVGPRGRFECVVSLFECRVRRDACWPGRDIVIDVVVMLGDVVYCGGLKCMSRLLAYIVVPCVSACNDSARPRRGLMLLMYLRVLY